MASQIFAVKLFGVTLYGSINRDIIMKNYLFTILVSGAFSLNANATSNLKDYQLTLMEESVSLLDFTMYQLNQEVSKYVAKEVFLDLGNGEGTVFDGALERIDSDDPYFASPLISRLGTAEFSLDEGKFLMVAEGTWSERYKTNIKTNMNNAAFLCKDMLVKLSIQIPTTPFLHWGYSTSNTRKLNEGEHIVNKFQRDFKFIARVNMGQEWENKPSVECSTNDKAFTDEEFDVDINFKGDWVNYK